MIYAPSPLWTKRGKHEVGDVSVFFIKSKMVWVEWSLMIPSRRKAKHVLRNGTGLALRAWTYRQLHNQRGNNGDEFKKQSARKSFPFLPSVWAERPWGMNPQRTQCCVLAEFHSYHEFGVLHYGQAHPKVSQNSLHPSWSICYSSRHTLYQEIRCLENLLHQKYLFDSMEHNHLIFPVQVAAILSFLLLLSKSIL